MCVRLEVYGMVIVSVCMLVRWNEAVSEYEHVWMCACRVVVGGDKYCVRAFSFHSGRSTCGFELSYSQCKREPRNLLVPVM